MIVNFELRLICANVLAYVGELLRRTEQDRAVSHVDRKQTNRTGRHKIEHGSTGQIMAGHEQEEDSRQH